MTGTRVLIFLHKEDDVTIRVPSPLCSEAVMSIIALFADTWLCGTFPVAMATIKIIVR